MIVAGFALALVAAGAILVASRGGGGPGDTSSSAFAARTSSAGEVTVEATLRQVNDSGAVAGLVFDTHSVELDLDVAAGTTLTVGGTVWPTVGWDGDGPGGHHREGAISFSAAGPARGEAVLTVAGLDEPVTFDWQVE